MQNERRRMEEKLLKPMSGFGMLFLIIALLVLSIAGCIISSISLDKYGFSLFRLAILVLSGFYVSIVFGICCAGFKVIHPNEAGVYTLFGKYYGTIAHAGFFYVNPFVRLAYKASHSEKAGTGVTTASGAANQPIGTIPDRMISLKTMTLTNDKQKINDKEGNPIEVGVVVIWRVVNATHAVFEVDDYKSYLSTQCDAAIRNIARQYSYDVSEEGDEKSLRASSMEISEELRKELQSRVNFAGLEVIETRISHLAYAQEIAAVMLQRQQAAAIIAARQKIVDGAVGMVEMALNKLSENKIVELDDERKAAMVSNLLVVLCGNRDAQPIVNSGSIY